MKESDLHMVEEKGFYELLEYASLEEHMERLYLRAKAELYNNGLMSKLTGHKKACEVFMDWVRDY